MQLILDRPGGKEALEARWLATIARLWGLARATAGASGAERAALARIAVSSRRASRVQLEAAKILRTQAESEARAADAEEVQAARHDAVVDVVRAHEASRPRADDSEPRGPAKRPCPSCGDEGWSPDQMNNVLLVPFEKTTVEKMVHRTHE